ncbi:hypothetical protein L6452_08253 [Arctium lappa]|uniref:Uncharacterized protein n=1 Tax=Arctium lappa TaxID=4217 RepID=A0ACB9DHS8_ARCLA|nr:hypothetical protein L6452_08253 [Arctium lappa]
MLGSSTQHITHTYSFPHYGRQRMVGRRYVGLLAFRMTLGINHGSAERNHAKERDKDYGKHREHVARPYRPTPYLSWQPDAYPVLKREPNAQNRGHRNTVPMDPLH